MSLSRSLTEGLEVSVGNLFRQRQLSQHKWDMGRNSSTGAEQIFAVRPGGVQNVAGTNRMAVVDQEFHIVLANSYNDTDGTTDYSIHENILAVSDDIEILWQNAFRSKFGIDGVMLCSDFSSAQPEIDRVGRMVSIEATFTIKYKTTTEVD